MKSVARLYTQFQPNQYDVTFDIDEDAMHFSGHVVLRGKKVGRPSQRITLHQNGLKVTKATIVKHDKKGEQTCVVARINNQNTLQEVRLHTDGMLYPGEYTVALDFEAPLTTAMTGIYPCFFKDGDLDKQLIMTQFESHYAREAFPCIDEPEAKAAFNLTLITRTGISVLAANTPVKKQSEKDGRLTTVFESTPKMSSYLLAFVFGEMISKSAKTKHGTDVNVWATVAQPADALDFSLDVAKRSIEFFEDYFGVRYPLPKADHVACPDFSNGAMENWGLITYRERLLVAYAGDTAQSTLEQIALVIAHETSHQWFGNLVTMRWWNDLWLNESFATIMEYQAVDSMFPDWHVWDTFVAAEGLSSLRRDAVAGVQAVRTEVRHPDQIGTIFDSSIVYAKGGRLLYMLKNYIGEDAFRAGLKAYFETHAYSNTEGADLWAALTTASGTDVAAFMDPWLTRSGFPLVSITQEGKTVTLQQEHFQDDRSKADPDRIWPLPLFSNKNEVPVRLDKATLKVSVADTDTVILNRDAMGQYLVRYVTPAQKQAISDMVRSQQLSEPERLMLLNSASMQARAGYESYDNVLAMLDAYSKEDSEPVWDIMASVIAEARRFIELDDSLEEKMKSFVGSLVAEQVARLGWDASPKESAADTKLRGLVLGLSTYADTETTVAKAKALFADFKNRGTALPSELRSLIFTVPVKYGDDEAFDYLLKLHDETQNSELKGDICDALTATRSPEKATLLLKRLKDPKLTKPQDIDRWYIYLLRNRYTKPTAWNWMVENWDWLEKTFKSDKSYDYVPRYAAGAVNTREYQKKYHDLFDDKQDQVALERNIQMGFEEIETRVTWLERDLEPVKKFFDR